ncbi:Gfo/Idh/MocA family oxidoreductase [Sphingomonas sp. JC676]|uniref:NAD(P)-dependent oxidoreductase n=1 Tax=Sphingomonas sp. JC676 TaxID=2768065 RepID=UPI001657ADF4|nr:NAD(P)-dependent oxidoreductase [Sphingomonas sp. JC676]MBC9035108.1 Gfo/Idh/MocA family oxidoreductase [Sphingomonas sp. JC676]
MTDQGHTIPLSTPRPSGRPRALVVGASETAALLHLPVLARLRDVGRIDLVEICDLRADAAEATRRRFGFASDSGDAVAAIHRPDIDLVYLLGNAQQHHALGIVALAAGKHLFVEKPIAPGYTEACALADAAHARGLVAVGGHNRRFLAALARLRALAGRGGWTYAEAVFHKPEYGRPPPFGAASWLTANGIHALDVLVYMMGGLPDHVTAQAGGPGACPSTFSALMRWPGNAQAVFLCDNSAGERREGYTFHAPGESWRVTEAGLSGRRDGGRPPVEFDLSPTGDGFAAEHDAFLAAVAGGPPPPNTIAALAPSLFLAELIEAGYHGPVRLPKPRAPARPARRSTVLLAGADRLRGALGTMPETWRLISSVDLEHAATPYPDVVAALLGQGADPLSEAALDRLPNLAVVGTVGLSLVRYGPDRLLARGITLVNASQAYAESVAEFALGLAVLGRRRAFVASRAMQRGGWGTAQPPTGARGMMLRGVQAARPIVAALGIQGPVRRLRRHRALASLSSYTGPSRDLAGALVGLIGWGANARAFSQRLLATGAHVIVYSDHADPVEIRAAGAEPASLAAVLAADIVSLHRGLTPGTRHCLGATELDRLRPGAVLINVARGALIEPAALVARLRRGDITACLDTFEQEPLPHRHPLRRLPNVFLTPHIAGGSPDMHISATREVIAKIAAHLDGAAVTTVTADRLATMT